MIDEKKIEEAANSSAEHYRWEVAISDDEVRTLCKKVFKEGAHWAIQEFLKGLWHDANEEPRNKASVLVIGGDNNDTIYYLVSDYQDWNHEVELWDINKWCYLDDLFPKQKGGSDD